jgi:hypothetical protein
MADDRTLNSPPFALQDIYIRDSRLRMADDFDPTIAGVALLGLFRTGEGNFTCNSTTFHKEEGDEETKWCRFLHRFEFAYVRPLEDGAAPPDDQIEQQLAAEVCAEIAVVYKLLVPEFPPQEHIKTWGAGPVMLHVWPYWREFCHNALMRMKLPVTMIPLLNLQATQKVE